MSYNKLAERLLRTTILTGIAAVMAAPAFAQDDATTDDRIVVTGSRVARDSFTSAAPLQSLDVQGAKDIGVTSVTELLQRSTVANGQQFDTTLNTASGNSNAAEEPSPGGVGSSNIGLRDLGPERTLVLINGRRLGASGVRGAPAQPDINLLPIGLVQRVEILTEGASAIYGADAAAGVINVILRDNFEGLELSTALEFPEADGGNTKQFSMIAGAQGERSHIIFGAEYFEQKRVSLGSRTDCSRSMAIIAATGEHVQECSNGFFDNAIGTLDPNVTAIIPSGDIFAWYRPGVSAAQSDLGIANWVSGLQLPTEAEEDGTCDLGGDPTANCRFNLIPFYSSEDEELRSDLVQPIRRFSTVALGGFEFDANGFDQEVFFEAYYFNRFTDNHATGVQIFPTVLGEIPNVVGGVVVGTVDNPLNPFPGDVQPIVTLDSFQQDRRTELEQFRFVGGLRGDVPVESLASRNWTYEAFFSYDRGVGFVSEALMNETNLNIALNTLRVEDGVLTCGVPTGPNQFGFLTGQSCVPVNFFADEVFTGGPNGEGVLTDAETRFLIGQRTNRTATEQLMFGGYFTGELFDIPGGGPVSTAFGGEYRKDSIFSDTDFLSSAGDNAGENPLTEEATRGERSIYDLYGELVVPLLRGHELAEDLTIEGAVRYTNEENFGSEVTYRGRLSYSPNDWMTFSGSYGTSFRAPNLRDAFLAPQQAGTSSGNDPCGVPTAANVGSVYIPANETRSQTVLDNCVADGADPFQLGLSANVTIPVTVGGNALDLKPETSRAYTATFLMSPPLSEDFDIDIAVSFFDIKVKDNIRSLSPESLMSRCFESPGLSSELCTRLQRGNNPNPLFNFITFIDASFVNVGEETSQGVDLNTRFSTSFENIMGDTPLDLVWSNSVTYQTKRTEQIFADEPVDVILGDYGTPKTRVQSNFALISGPWQANFETRWIQGTDPSLDALSNVDFNCPGPTGVAAPNTTYAGTPDTFAVCHADGRIYQDASLSYQLTGGVRATIGVNNLFDKQPPRISRGLGSNRSNIVTSSGYDQIGRTFFVNLVGSF